MPTTSSKPEYILNGDGSHMTEQQIVADILSHMSASDKTAICLADSPYGFFGWGMHIRNRYGLWHNEQLKREWEEQRATNIIDGVDHSPSHPDNVSGRIMEAVFVAVKGEVAK